MQIDWDVPIVMDDGIVLRADVFRPADDRPHPVVLNHGPYGKNLAFQEGYADQWNKMITRFPEVAEGTSNRYQNWESVDPERWVPHGYVVVRIDSRGAGRSPGYLDPLSPRENRDYYECIEWTAVQPWCTGKVGLIGISYYAINQWLVAGLQPPHLAAMIPWDGAADWYRDMTHHGGIVSVFWGNWMDMQAVPVQHGVGDAGARDPNTGEAVAGPETLPTEVLAAERQDLRSEILAHPFDDDYHRERSADWERVTVPLLSSANWGALGLHSRGNFEGFVRAASEQKWLEVHGYEHWSSFYTDHGVALQRRFFDHFLKGADNGWEREPRVSLAVRRIDGFTSRAETEWPIARTRWTRLYLDAADLRLSPQPAAAESTSSYRGLGDGLTFQSEPLDREVEITGPVAASLYVSSTADDADLFVILRAFAPDGSEVDFQGMVDPHTPLSQGWLRASHRKLDPALSTEYRPYHPHDTREPLSPGQVYACAVELWPTSIVLPPGYRIALTVQGRDYERDVEPATLGCFVEPMRGSGPFLHTDPRDRPATTPDQTVTLHTGGPWQSSVLLPIIPPDRAT